jgi:hypothetical protein
VFLQVTADTMPFCCRVLRYPRLLFIRSSPPVLRSRAAFAVLVLSLLICSACRSLCSAFLVHVVPRHLPFVPVTSVQIAVPFVRFCRRTVSAVS